MSTTDQSLTKFYTDLQQEITTRASLEEEEGFKENVFTEVFCDYLIEAGEISDVSIAYWEARGIRVNGYSISEDENELTLFADIFKPAPEPFSVSKTDVAAMFNRAKNFYLKSVRNYHESMEESTEAFDLSRSIAQTHEKIQTVRIVLLTNGLVKSAEFEVETENDTDFIYSVWDLERVFRVFTSGNAREKIEIDLEKEFGTSLQALKISVPELTKAAKDGTEEISGGYDSYFTVIPGTLLYEIYKTYNSRLLEKNVRAFLQARGNVNKGIRQTIREIPEMFLAYNNGISATAESLEIRRSSDDGSWCEITGLSDFQIVNGGQTTASIYNACIKNQQPLSNIFVQAKITVLHNQDRMSDVLPNISKYANTQNKIQLADFSANDEFHQQIESFSRSVWAPARTGGEKQTKWYYERARGQYNDERSRDKSTKHFDSIYPKKQYLSKVDLARYENLWNLKPYAASKGGQTSFRLFTIDLKKRGSFIPDQNYYEALIAKAILYREIREIVKSLQLKGYWANVSDYTFAYLTFKSSSRLDLERIWKSQAIPASYHQAAETAAKAIYDYLTTTEGIGNVTQWCKQEKCWMQVRELSIPMPDEFEKDLIDAGKKKKAAGIESAGIPEKELIDDLKHVPADTWFALSNWGKETQKLRSWQNGLSYSLGRIAARSGDPSPKQAKQGIKILKTAYDSGFLSDAKYQELFDRQAEYLS